MNLLRSLCFAFIFALSLIGCGEQDKVSNVLVQDSTDDLAQGEVVGTTSLVGVGHISEGDVQLIYVAETNTYSLVMENFRSQNGPDLKVYLSEGSQPGNFLDLGGLKSTNGTLRYDFPAAQFDERFDHVLIWCAKFGVTFGQGEFEAP